MDSHCSIKKILIPAIIGLSFLLSANLCNTSTALAITKLERQQLRQELLELEKYTKPFGLTLQKVSKLVGPSVVSILAEKKFVPEEQWGKDEGGGARLFGPFKIQPPDKRRRHSRRNHGLRMPRHGFGSGVIVDERGYVLTNLHLIEGFVEGEITIILHDGKKYEGCVVGEDPNTDLAVLKMEGKEFEAAKFGDSNATEVGDWVIAIGSPFGFQQTVSIGIISAKGRTRIIPSPKPFTYQDFLQTDAAINPGNSGGPLVNLRGEVIGINTAIVTRTGGYQGIGFAISSTIAKETMLALIEKGRVIRGYLGVGIEDIDADLAVYLNYENIKELMIDLDLSTLEGAFVTEVYRNTPAWKAGILLGDVIIEIDFKKVLNADRLQHIVRHIKVDSLVPVKIIRDRTEKILNVKIVEQPARASEPEITRRLGPQKTRPKRVVSVFGLMVEELTPQIANSLGYEGVAGVVVKSVEHNSLAEEAGIEEGDIISQVGRYAVRNITEFIEAITKSDKGEEVIVFFIIQKGFIRIK
ncbi:MAG: trypsin-like peptidase domain-containing protein [Candidatus Brocadiales bacterium]